MYFGVTHSLPSPAGNYKLEIDLSSDISFEADLGGEFRTTYQYDNSILKTTRSPEDLKRFSHGDSYVCWNSLSIRSSYNMAVCILTFNNQTTLRNLAGLIVLLGDRGPRSFTTRFRDRNKTDRKPTG